MDSAKHIANLRQTVSNIDSTDTLTFTHTWFMNRTDTSMKETAKDWQICRQQKIKWICVLQCIESNLIESVQAEFFHCSVHDLDQVQQLGMASTHFHPQKGPARDDRHFHLISFFTVHQIPYEKNTSVPDILWQQPTKQFLPLVLIWCQMFSGLIVPVVPNFDTGWYCCFQYHPFGTWVLRCQNSSGQLSHNYSSSFFN